VVIADTGHGITADRKTKIFEPFFTTKGQTGTGLGLWISSEIVGKHNGTMRVKSSVHPGKSGTVFSIFLPENSFLR
jgi:signal transduction histidine kinase